jgi:hypothetical protein
MGQLNETRQTKRLQYEIDGSPVLNRPSWKFKMDREIDLGELFLLIGLSKEYGLSLNHKRQVT